MCHSRSLALYARTWTLVTTVAESGRNVDNGYLVQLGNGNVLLTMRSIIDATSYRLVVYRSTNNGANWSSLSTIDSNESPGGRTDRGLWEPTFNILPNGSLAVFYANEKYAASSPRNPVCALWRQLITTSKV